MIYPVNTADANHDNATKSDESCKGDCAANEMTAESNSPANADHNADRQQQSGTKQVRFTDEDGEYLGSVPRKVKLKPSTREEKMFAKPRSDELEGLLKNGTFKKRHKLTLPKGEIKFGAQFADETKRAGQGLKKKSLLVS